MPVVDKKHIDTEIKYKAWPLWPSFYASIKFRMTALHCTGIEYCLQYRH